MSVKAILEDVEKELNDATSRHGSLRSHHEAYSVILEELDEYWDLVKLRATMRDPNKLRKELIQTAAMCVRAINDVCNDSSCCFDQS